MEYYRKWLNIVVETPVWDYKSSNFQIHIHSDWFKNNVLFILMDLFSNCSAIYYRQSFHRFTFHSQTTDTIFNGILSNLYMEISHFMPYWIFVFVCSFLKLDKNRYTNVWNYFGIIRSSIDFTDNLCSK